MALVTVDDVVLRLDPQPPVEADQRITTLISDAERKIRTAFLKAGRDFDAELVSVPWLLPEAEDVVREMVSAAIIIGPNAGVRTASSSTGQESDSVTYADVGSVSFSGVKLTDAQRQQLGLDGGGLPRGSFPPPRRWPEVMHRE